MHIHMQSESGKYFVSKGSLWLRSSKSLSKAAIQRFNVAVKWTSNRGTEKQMWVAFCRVVGAEMRGKQGFSLWQRVCLHDIG